MSGGKGEAPLADIKAPPSPPELRMVLLGKTGAGKSATGNTILGREEFRSEASSSAVTRECEKRTGQVAVRRVAVIDTPELSQDKLQIRSCVSLSALGPHAFLLVIPVGRFTEEERRAVETVQEIFSEEAVRRYMMLLFTHSDKLKGKTIEDYIQTGSKELQQLVEKCGNRYHVLNTEDRSNHTQVSQLLGKIDNMVKGNNSSYYTNEIYQKAEAKIRQRQEEILKEEEETILREEEELRAKHLKELENLKRKMRLEIQKQDEKIRELEERIEEQEEELRKEQGENHRIKLEEELRRKREEREREEQEKEDCIEKGKRERGEYEEKHRREMETVRQRYKEIIRPETERYNGFISRYEKPAEARGERAALGAVISAVAGALVEGAEVGAVLHTVSRAISEETALGAVMHAAKEAVREGAAQRAVISAVAAALREGAAIGTVLHTVAEAIEAAPQEPSQEQ
ncbi:GTPase IMAP family member 4-like [Acipenser ruthenus]|uniref:GTPase IMAP family member 4-like n=1 Tax=Acipenser ruthenus TaxID=7906 RepID=UPI0027422C92|nr:GTPase IMAP family member 4-like [Acipenser ruthenus]